MRNITCIGNGMARLALALLLPLWTACGMHAPSVSAPASPGMTALLAGCSLPDPELTPGSLCTDSDEYFDGYRYSEHVAHCKRHVTKAMKQQIGESYGVAESDWKDYEFDHLIPLGIGGSTSVDNLWPQPLDEAKEKDKLENELYQEMKDGTVTQADAVRQIHEWRCDSLRARAAR